jgi:hypothetical protein
MENMNENFLRAIKQEETKHGSEEKYKPGLDILKNEVEKNTDPETGEYKPYHERVIEKVEKELPHSKDEEEYKGGR